MFFLIHSDEVGQMGSYLLLKCCSTGPQINLLLIPWTFFLLIPFEILKITSRWNLLRRNVCSFLDKKIEGLENFEKLPCTVTSTCLFFRIVFCIAAILFRTFFCQILSGSGRKKWSGVLLSNFTIRRIDK